MTIWLRSSRRAFGGCFHVIEDLIRQLKALDLMTTELEGEDWCIAADRAMAQAAAELEVMHAFLAQISDFARAKKQGLQ